MKEIIVKGKIVKLRGGRSSIVYRDKNRYYRKVKHKKELLSSEIS